jgi:hypothetical protein
MWRKRENDAIEGEGAPPDGAGAFIPGVKPYVTDNRNILLLRPIGEKSTDQKFLKTLAYAFQRGIQVIYQVEEQEVALELIGQGAHQRILLWEAAEGGTGVWDRLLRDKQSFAELAKEALRICHFDPDTGEKDAQWVGECGSACYDCLLSYANQIHHRHLDRYAVRDYLLQLTQAEVMLINDRRSYQEQYDWLKQRIDPASSLESEFLDFLFHQNLRLPDFAQYCPENEVPSQPDFYYERERIPGVCIFVDGPPHDKPRQAEQDTRAREALQERGYRVIVIRYDRSFIDQVLQSQDIFTPV